MTCETQKEAMCEYLDGLLGEHEQKAFEAHLADCADCRRDVGETADTLHWLKQAEEISPPRTIRPAVLAQLKQEKRSGLRIPAGFPQAVAAAVLFLVLVAGNLPGGPFPAGRNMDALSGDNGLYAESADIYSEDGAGAPMEITTVLERGEDVTTDDVRTTVETAPPAAERTSRGRILFNGVLLPLLAGFAWLAVKKRKEAMP